MAGLVTEDKFNELVGSTTNYLQDLINRVSALEAKVAELESKPAKKEAK
jgi:BMFP domain-containing protein YqiC